MAVVIGAEIRTDGRELELDLRRDARMVEKRLGGAFRSVGRIASATFTGIGSAGKVLGRALLAPFRLLTSIQGLIGVGLGGLGADRMIRNATALELRTKALARQLDITERSAGRLISRINAASAGMLDFARASELANQAGILDIPTAGLERLLKVFTMLAVARGREDSISADLEELLNSIARGEPPKRFGIFVGAEELAGLDLAGKQALTLRRTLEELEKRASRLGLEGNELFLVYNGIFGNIKDIVIEVGRWITQTDLVGEAIRGVSELTGNILNAIQNGNGKDVVGALLVSIAQAGPAIVQTLGNLIEKGFKLGAAALLDVIGSLDLTALGQSAAAAIGRGIQSIAPRMAQLMGITEQSLAAAEGASGNMLQRAAVGLRESAGNVDTFGPLRQFYGDVMDRFRPTKEARTGDLVPLGIEAIDPGRITPEQIQTAKSRLQAPFADRFNRVLEGLLTDPKIAGRYQDAPRARPAIRKRAQQAAIAELEADRILAGFGSRGQLARLGQAQDRIAQHPRNAELLREELAGNILGKLSPEKRDTLDTFNRRASTDHAEYDPLGVTRRQLGASPDASMLELILRARGFRSGSERSTDVTSHPNVQSDSSNDQSNQQLETQNGHLEKQNQLMQKNTDLISRGTEALDMLNQMLDQFVASAS